MNINFQRTSSGTTFAMGVTADVMKYMLAKLRDMSFWSDLTKQPRTHKTRLVCSK